MRNGISLLERTGTHLHRIRHVAPDRPRDTSAGLARIVVKLRPEQYDELSRHVREVGSTMSAFCRESIVKVMREVHLEVARSHRETYRGCSKTNHLDRCAALGTLLVLTGP
jgi:hypothetical protein